MNKDRSLKLLKLDMQCLLALSLQFAAKKTAQNTPAATVRKIVLAPGASFVKCSDLKLQILV